MKHCSWKNWHGMAVDRPLSWPFACLGTIITGYAIGAKKFIDNTYEEVLLLNHCHRSAVTRAPEQRSLPKAGFYASTYIYIRTWSRTKPYFWKQLAPQKHKIYSCTCMHFNAYINLPIEVLTDIVAFCSSYIWHSTPRVHTLYQVSEVWCCMPVVRMYVKLKQHLIACSMMSLYKIIIIIQYSCWLAASW